MPAPPSDTFIPDAASASEWPRGAFQAYVSLITKRLSAADGSRINKLCPQRSGHRHCDYCRRLRDNTTVIHDIPPGSSPCLAGNSGTGRPVDGSMTFLKCLVAFLANRLQLGSVEGGHLDPAPPR